MTCDVLLCGTGSFAARIAFDLAATSRSPIRVAIAGRNAARLDWLVTASNARAKIFGSPARFSGLRADLMTREGAGRVLDEARPRIVVQAASAQTSSVIAQTGNAWAALVRDGGLSATALAQTAISLRVAEAITAAGDKAAFVNCSFPDVVNGVIAAAGHRVLCGFGNIGILSSVFAGALDLDPSRIRLLAHYQNLAAFRAAPAQRAGRTARVWLDGEEVADVFHAFAGVKLTPEPVIDVSGATGVPMIQAYVEGQEWRGHLPGPSGLSGGYPVVIANGVIALDLPPGLTEAEAVAWNRSFEEEKGLVVDPDGRVRFTGRLAELLREHTTAFSDGFRVEDFEAAYAEMQRVRIALGG